MNSGAGQSEMEDTRALEELAEPELSGLEGDKCCKRLGWSRSGK